MAIRVQNRRGTEARWLEVDPILLDGEIAFVKDKNYIKIGDGIKTFSELDKISGGDSGDLPTNLIYFSETQPEEDCDIIGEIIDNTDSTRTDAAASANMARHLNEKIEIVKDGIGRSFVDSFLARANAYVPNTAIYNEVDDTFAMHGLTLTRQEAIDCFSVQFPYNTGDTISLYEYGAKVRTNMPMYNYINNNFTRFANGNTYIESIIIRGYDNVNCNNAFYNCTNLKKISMGGSISSANNTFTGCAKLSDLSMGLYVSVSIVDSPLLTRESIRRIIDMSRGGITITLHPDAYDRLTQEDLDAATAKNITIVTPE